MKTNPKKPTAKKKKHPGLPKNGIENEMKEEHLSMLPMENIGQEENIVEIPEPTEEEKREEMRKKQFYD